MFLLVFVIVLIFIGFLGVLADFALRSRPNSENNPLPSTAIVFTGQVSLTASSAGWNCCPLEAVQHLFISGVNPKAGLTMRGFADQFSATADQRVWLETGKITLAPDANSTLDNALEAACWLEIHPDVRAVALITSQRHMARASLALERAIGPSGSSAWPQIPSRHI